MRLDSQDLKHVHKVLSADIEECVILIGDDMADDKAIRLSERMEDDRRVLARVEKILGYRPRWAPRATRKR